jgi:hypothetical protein
MTENINTQITASADFSSLISQIHQAVSQLALLQQKIGASNVALSQQINASNNAFANTLKNSNQFSTHFVTLAGDTEKFGKALDQGKLKLKDYYNSWQQYHRQGTGLIKDLAKQQAALQNAIVQPMGRNAQGQMQFNVHVPAGIDELANKTKIAKQEMSILNKVMSDGANQLINWGKNTQWAGRQLTVGLTVPMAAFGQAAAQSFMQIDTELTRLTKVYGGLSATSQTELTKVRNETIKTAKELSSAYGVNFKETIALAADIAATGKQGNELMSSLRETTRLSVLGEVSRQDAMKATLAIQNAFKQNTTELGQSIDFLNAVENQTSTTLQDLVNAIPKAGPVVKGLGGNVKDLALMLVAMKEGGVDAASAANGLKSALGSLINPTKTAKGLFQSFGIDLGSIVNNNAGHVTDTIMALQEALNKLNPLQKQQALEALFGKYQFARMGALFDNLGKKGSQTLQVLDLMKASTQDLAGVAQRELAQQTESASGKYKRALESLRADLATVGSGFLGVSTNLLKIADGILKAFNALPSPVKKFVTLLGGLTAVAGPIIMLTGVFSNFLGYVLKGFAGIRAFFSHADKFKLLTPDIRAANEAGLLIEKTFYSDAEAAIVLKNALSALKLEMQQIAALANEHTITAKPLVGGISGTQIGGLDFAHYNPQARLTEEQRLQQTFHTAIPLDPSTNKKIGENPQVMMMPGQGIAKVQGLTMINGATTGINAAESAKWNAMMTTMAMRTKSEMQAVEKVLIETGQLPAEFMADFNVILPKMQAIATTAAESSARVARSAEQGILSVKAAQSEIEAINAAMIADMNALSIASGVPQARMTMVPGTNTAIASGTAVAGNQDYNMRSVLRSGEGRMGGITSRISNALKIGIRRIKLQNGGTAIGHYSKGFTPKSAMAAARMLKAFAKRSSGIGGLRTPNLRGTGSGPSTISASEAGTGISFGLLTKRNSKVYQDPTIQEYGITPTSGNDFLVHALTPGYRARTASLPTMGTQSTPSVPADRFAEFGITTSSKSPYLQTLPTQFVKNTKQFNEALRAGADASQFRQVTGPDMVSLLLFLKDQGVSAGKAKVIAERAANVLNELVASSNVPITEELFGNMVNRASVRAIRSGFLPSMTRVVDSMGYDMHTRNRGLAPVPYANGVTKLPGYGGGDIIPAMLEPGESVVTKQATARYAPIIDMMNKGQLPGFAQGVTGIGKLGNFAKNIITGPGIVASLVGGIAGQNIGNQLGGTFGGLAGGIIGPALLSPVMKLGGALFNVAKAGGGVRTVLMGLRTALMANPWGLAITGTLAVAAGMWKLWDNARKARQASVDAFKLTGKEAAEAKIKVVSFSDNIKSAMENAKKQAELNKALIESTKIAGGTGGLNMTVKELKEMQKSAKETMPDIVKMFDQMDRSDVVANAAALKAQFVAGGKSAEEASKMIFSIISVSNKAGMAVKAISSQAFVDIKDKATAATSSIIAFNNAMKVGADKKELAAAFDSAMSSVDAYYQSLVGSKDETGHIITQTEALAMSMDKLNKNAKTNKAIGADQLAILLKERPEMLGILSATDSTADAYAKIKLYTSGIAADLTNISGKQAQSMLSAQTALQQSATNITTDASLGAPTSGLAALGTKAATDSKNAAAAASAAAKAAQRDITAETNAIDKKIQAIKAEADARKKALSEQQASADISLQIQQQQLKYQQAIATGNMADAASAQLEIQKLSGQRQTQLAQNAIDNKAQSQTEALQSQKDGLAASIAAAQKKATDLQGKATGAADYSSKIQAIQQAIAGLISETSLTSDPATIKANGIKLSQQLDALRKLGSEGVKAANAIAPTSGKVYNGSTLENKPTDYAQVLQQLASKNEQNAKDQKLFSGSVSDFAAAVALFKGVNTTGSNTTFTSGKAAAAAFNKKTGGSWGASQFDNFETKANTNSDSVSSQFGKGMGYSEGTEFSVDHNFKRYTYKMQKNKDGNLYAAFESVTQLPKKAQGGLMFGPGTGTSDSIPAMLSRGEYVVKASAVQKYGVGTLDSINSLKMAAGGMVMSYGDTSRYMGGGRIAMAQGGQATTGNVIISNNITVNGTNLSGDEIARAITVEQNRQMAMSGRRRTY